MFKKIIGIGIILIAVGSVILGSCSSSRNVEFQSVSDRESVDDKDAALSEGEGGSDMAVGNPATGEQDPSGAMHESETPGQEAASSLYCVYVCGQVRCPGVYELEAGKRICDAIDSAGGMTGEAAGDYWNLAELLTDGQMIYVPTEKEARERSEGMPGTGADSEAKGDGKVNINTADKAELMTISGIGEGRAGSIITYREKNGAFGCIEDLTRVSGIGDALFDNIKDMIKVY